MSWLSNALSSSGGGGNLLFGGVLGSLFGGDDQSKKYSKAGSKYQKEALQALEEAKKIAAGLAAPGTSVMSSYYTPAFREAWKSALDLGSLPALRSGYQTAWEQAQNRLARAGLGLSGIAQATQQQLQEEWAQQLGKWQTMANLQRQSALADMARQALSGGLQAGGLQLQPYSALGNLLSGASQMQYGLAQQQAQQQAQNLGGLGQLLGQVATLALLA